MKKPQEYAALLKSMSIEWKWLLKYVFHYRFEIVFYVIAGIVATLMGLASSIASKYLIDAVVAHDKDIIAFSVGLVIGLAVLQAVISAVTSRVASALGTRIRNEIRGDIYEHMVRSQWRDIKKFHSGELINRLEGDVSTVSGSIINFIPSIFTRTIQFAGCLGIVLYYDPTMALFTLLSTPFLFLTSRLSTKMMRKYSKESREINGKILSFSEESMQNLQTIKAFDLVRTYTGNFKSLLDNYRKIKIEHDKFSIAMTMFMSLIGLAVSYSCYGWGIFRLWQGAITYGTMSMFLQISGKLTASFSALVSLVPGAISIATAAGRIMEVTSLPLEEDVDGDKAKLLESAARENGITVFAEKMSYSYEDGSETVLNNIDFRVEPGETVALIGQSGEGKTTILRLVLGLMKPDNGTIQMHINGEKLNVSDSTRRFCSYVPQENSVFSGTVADNLRMVRAEATDEELIEALEIAEIWSYIKEQPLGLQTVIGERGINFSEGQIQRISIARAIIRKSPVLLMDEATSALDAETEGKVLNNLMKSDKKRTCIITTHRPSMLQYCDRIYKLDENGRLSVFMENKREIKQ